MACGWLNIVPITRWQHLCCVTWDSWCRGLLEDLTMAPLLIVNPLDLILNTFPAYLDLSSRFIVEQFHTLHVDFWFHKVRGWILYSRLSTVLSVCPDNKRRLSYISSEKSLFWDTVVGQLFWIWWKKIGIREDESNANNTETTFWSRGGGILQNKNCLFKVRV